MSASDFDLDRAAFLKWINETDGEEKSDHFKKAVSVALNECCSETQRTYIKHYFFESLKISEIANMYGRNKSSVSRGIKAGLNNMYSHLRFVSPRFL